MIKENRVFVQVLKNENNSNELFKIWNIKNRTNIECSVDNCKNDVNDNAYITTIVNANKKFIIPLCQECYELYHNKTPSFNNFGAILGINKNLLIEYTN